MERNRPHYDSTYSYNGKRIALAAITVRGGETKRATLA
jgi:hypothetical protein